MVIKYKLKESDYLTNQLFIASNSERIKKKRRNSVFAVAISYLIFSIMCFAIHSTTIGVAFIIFSALWYFLYPIYQTKKYYNHYKSFIEDNYKEICDSEITMELERETIICRDLKAESKIQIKAINEIYELPNVYLINLIKASNLVLSKSNLDNEQGPMREFINKLSIDHKIEVQDLNHWKWS